MSFFAILERVLCEFGSRDRRRDGGKSAPSPLEFREVLFSEFGVRLTDSDLSRCRNDAELVALVGEHLPRDSAGETIISVFCVLDESAKRYLNCSVSLRWFTPWIDYANVGNWLTSPDWQDFFEMFSDIEEHFNIHPRLTDDIDLQTSPGTTAKRIWRIRTPPESL